MHLYVWLSFRTFKAWCVQYIQISKEIQTNIVLAIDVDFFSVPWQYIVSKPAFIRIFYLYIVNNFPLGLFEKTWYFFPCTRYGRERPHLNKEGNHTNHRNFAEIRYNVTSMSPLCLQETIEQRLAAVPRHATGVREKKLSLTKDKMTWVSGTSANRFRLRLAEY